MGGGGTHVCRELAGIGIGNIQIVDGDRIELSNLGRQFLYDYSDIGESKVSVAKRKIEDINPFINVIEVEKFVTSQEELVCILNNSDLVVLAADEPPIILMNWVNSICVEQGIPFLTLGVNEFHCVAGPFVVPKKSPCINCIDMEDNMINPYRYELINQLKNYEFPWKEAVFPPLISLISSIVSFEISRYLLTEKSVLVGRTLTINPIDWSFEWEEWHRNSMCTTCHSKVI